MEIRVCVYSSELALWGLNTLDYNFSIPVSSPLHCIKRATRSTGGLYAVIDLCLKGLLCHTGYKNTYIIWFPIT